MAVVTALSGTAISLTIKKNSDYNGKVITFDETTKSIVTTTHEEITEKYVETVLGTTDLFEEEKEVESTVNNQYATDYESKVDEQENYLYQELRLKFDKVLEKKGFSIEVENILNGAFELLYANYDSSYKIYENLNMQNKKEYIEGFIDNIEKNINKIDLVDETDPKYSHYHKELKIARGIYIFN